MKTPQVPAPWSKHGATPNLSINHDDHIDRVHNGYCYECQEWIELTAAEPSKLDSETVNKD